MANKSLVTTVVASSLSLVVGLGGGYYFRNYQLSKTRRDFAGGNGNIQRFVAGRDGSAPMAQGGNFMRGGVFGSVISVDDKTITVKLADGSSKIVLFSDTTTYENTVTAKLSDVKVGENISVMGSSNSDGSVTATNIQINPQLGRMMPSPMPTPQK